MIKTFWLLLLFLVTCTGVYAQHFPVVHYTMENGLPSDKVNEIYRDKKGFLWFATDKGIARYDGISFKVFTAADGLAGNDALSFMEDDYGRLWISLFNGELCYYKDGSFHSRKTDAFLEKNFKAGFVENFFLQKDSSIILTFNDFHSFIVFKKDHRRIYTLGNEAVHEVSRLSPNLYAIRSLKSQQLLFMDSNGRVLNRRPAIVKTVTGGQRSKYYIDDSCIYNLDGSVLFPYKKMGINVRKQFRFYRNDAGTHILATSNGMYAGSDTVLFPGQQIYSVTQDLNNDYWLTVKDNGVYKIKNWNSGYRKYDGIYSHCSHAFAVDSGVYYSTDNQVFLFRNGNVSRILNPLTHDASIKPLTPQYFLYHQKDYFLFYGKNVHAIYDIHKRNLETRTYELQGVVDENKSAFEYRNDLYLVSIKSFQRIAVDKDSRLSWKERVMLPVNRIFCMTAEKNTGIWFSTEDGIYRYKDNRSLKQEQFGTLSFSWFDFFTDYLIGITHDDQLLLCSQINGPVHIDTVQGPGGTRIYPLDSSRFLIVTKGLYRLLTLYPSDHILRYTVQTIENPFLPPNPDFVCVNTSTCFFLAKGSVTEMPLKDLFTKTRAPLLYFTTARNKERSFGLYHSTNDTLRMDYAAARYIQVGFEPVSLGSPEVTYQYALTKDGADEWLPLNATYVGIANPSYGSYILKVRAKTAGSDFSQPIILHLHIINPFWATWWFWSVCAVLLLLLILLIIRRRERYLIREKVRAHEKEIRFLKSEYKALNALMNPHFIFNTLSSLQVLIHQNEKKTADKYLRIFSSLVRQNMQNLSDELITLQREMDLVENYVRLEKLRFKEWLNYEIRIDEEVDMEAIFIPPLIVQPFVENAIRHGLMPMQSDKSFLLINIYELGDNVHIEIEDNGIGFSAQESTADCNHQSFGIRNIRERVSQLALLHNIHITISVEEKNRKPGGTGGTKIILVIRV